MISIIVPVYNVEKYIIECVRSLVNQTYTDIEIVLVDDGSTDMSGKICDELCQKDERIRVFHKANGGLMSAWKYGVLKSSGQYIGFVDSDDWVDSDMYEHLLDVITKNQADVALCGLVKEYEDGTPSECEIISLQREFYSTKQVVNEIYPVAICSGGIPTRGISPNRVTKLYKRELLESILDDCSEEVSIGEDLLSTIAALAKEPSICIVHNFFPYHYRINNSSMIKTFNTNKYDKVRCLNKSLKEIDKQMGGVFTRQIANDYVDLILKTIEQEILVASIGDKHIIADIISETKNELFCDSLIQMDKLKLSKKNKIYLLLIKMRLFRVLFYLRRKYRR